MADSEDCYNVGMTSACLLSALFMRVSPEIVDNLDYCGYPFAPAPETGIQTRARGGQVSNPARREAVMAEAGCFLL